MLTLLWLAYAIIFVYLISPVAMWLDYQGGE